MQQHGESKIEQHEAKHEAPERPTAWRLLIHLGAMIFSRLKTPRPERPLRTMNFPVLGQKSTTFPAPRTIKCTPKFFDSNSTPLSRKMSVEDARLSRFFYCLAARQSLNISPISLVIAPPQRC
jgi:hypothetical protein